MMYYKQTRSKIPILPAMPEDFANMDDISVSMETLKRKAHDQVKRLESPTELLTLENAKLGIAKRILITGGPGSGKSITLSKLAYDWATQKDNYFLNQYQLIFALNMREIRHDMDIVDAINEQLMPQTPKEELLKCIKLKANSIAYLFDGYDEGFDFLKSKSDFNSILSSKWLQESLVIVTSKPHMVESFKLNNLYHVYTHAYMLPFSIMDRINFVARYFTIPPRHIHYLVEELQVDKEDEYLSGLFTVIRAGTDQDRSLHLKVSHFDDERLNYTLSITDGSKRGTFEYRDDDDQSNSSDFEQHTNETNQISAEAILQQCNDGDDEDSECSESVKVCNRSSVLAVLNRRKDKQFDDEYFGDHDDSSVEESTYGESSENDDESSENDEDYSDEDGDSREDEDNSSEETDDSSNESDVHRDGNETDPSSDSTSNSPVIDAAADDIYNDAEVDESLSDTSVTEDENNVITRALQLLYRISEIPELSHLSSIPQMMNMICLLWDGTSALPKSSSQIFQQSIRFLKQCKKSPSEREDVEFSRNLFRIGEMAMDGILHHKFTFNANNALPEKALTEGLELGLLYTTSIRSGIDVTQQIAFTHASYQEMCAGFFLGDLAKTHFEMFMDKLDKIDIANIVRFGLLLRCCCAQSDVAAKMIIGRAVTISTSNISDLKTQVCNLGNEDFRNDPWFFCLILLTESCCSKELLTELQPLFQQKHLKIYFGESFENLTTINNFFEDVMNEGKQSMFSSIHELSIVFESNSYVCTAFSVQVFTRIISCIQNTVSLEIDIGTHKMLAITHDHIDPSYFKCLSLLRKIQITGIVSADVFLEAFVMGLSEASRKELTHIDISCPFTVVPIMHFLQSFQSLTNLFLHKIDSMHREKEKTDILKAVTSQRLTVIHLKGINVYFTSLKRHLPIIHELVLNECTFESDSDLQEVKKSLETICSKIPSHLPLTRFSVIQSHLTIGCIRVLTEICFQMMANLRCVSFIGNGLNEMCVKMIAESLVLLPKLERLDLGGNYIGKSAQVLSDKLQDVKTLTSLTLPAAAVHDDDAVSISIALRSLTELERLDISENSIGESINAFSDAICSGLKLQCFLSAGINLDESGSSKLCRALQTLSNLEVLDLSGNHNFDMNELKQVIESLTNLKELTLDNCHLTDHFLCSMKWVQLDNLMKLSLAGVDTWYGIQSVEHLFKTMHHLTKLVRLTLVYKDTDSIFFNDCCLNCSLESQSEQPTSGDALNVLFLGESKLRAIVKYVAQFENV